jgi:hypothetical protein
MDEMKDKVRKKIFIEDLDMLREEIEYILSLVTDDFDSEFFRKVYKDIHKLFNGAYPGYRASNTEYHNMEHTLSVTLATARLIHGGYHEGYCLSSKEAFLCLLGSIFHDVGLIQTEDDKVGSGAKYTVGHEERSIEFMKNYLAQKTLSARDLDDCAHLIMCTMMNMSPKEIPFRSDVVKTMGHMVGSADLLAQMADRNYLENILLLFKEFEEAGIPGMDSELGLLTKTERFYNDVAKKRLADDLGGVMVFMRSHYKHRWDIDRDLYEECISKNIHYLRSLIDRCEESYGCYLDNLRRAGITQRIQSSTQ